MDCSTQGGDFLQSRYDDKEVWMVALSQEVSKNVDKETHSESVLFFKVHPLTQRLTQHLPQPGFFF